jgi:SAM-dependent methyltransferase
MDADLLESAGAISVDDPALIAAPLARRVAREHCQADPAAGASCEWFHGPRLAFRALGLKLDPGPAEHADLAAATLARLAPTHRRVLLAGGADHGFAAMVHGVYRAAGAPLTLMMAESCETPLRLVEWYARRAGLDIATVRADMTEIDDLGPFDLIAAEAVLGHVAPDRIDAILAQWRGLLRPGGRILALAPIQAREEDVIQWSKRLAGMVGYARRAIAEGTHVGFDAFELVAAIEAFRARHRPRAFVAVEEVEAMGARGGFTVERTEHRHFARALRAPFDAAMILARRD